MDYATPFFFFFNYYKFLKDREPEQHITRELRKMIILNKKDLEMRELKLDTFFNSGEFRKKIIPERIAELVKIKNALKEYRALLTRDTPKAEEYRKKMQLINQIKKVISGYSENIRFRFLLSIKYPSADEKKAYLTQHYIDSVNYSIYQLKKKIRYLAKIRDYNINPVVSRDTQEILYWLFVKSLRGITIASFKIRKNQELKKILN